jgi:hypothetical protein
VFAASADRSLASKEHPPVVKGSREPEGMMRPNNLIESTIEIRDQTAAPWRGFAVRSLGARNLLTFLMVFGPGLIVMEADNDAGAVSTYVQAGAQYGTHLLWILIVLLPMTYFVQEMVVRLGIATWQGHATMIYKRFGSWWGLFSLFDLLLINFLTLVTEFAAIALALNKLGVNPRMGVPLSASHSCSWSGRAVTADGSAQWSRSVFSISDGSRLLFPCVHRWPR